MLEAEYLLNAVFSQKMTFMTQKCAFFTILGKKLIFWQNEDINKKKKKPAPNIF